jgi:hypothetical protein
MPRLTVNGGVVWHAQHQGPGTGMDSDTVDGQHAAALLPSDQKLKRDIIPIQSTKTLEQLLDLLVEYRYNTDPDTKLRYGVIAQELERHGLGHLVYESNGIKSIDPFSVLFYMTKSLAVELAEAKREIRDLQLSGGVRFQ